MARKKKSITPVNVDKIRDYKEELENFHSTRIARQKEEQQYYDDEFQVSIKSPYHVRRTGGGARIVDTACDCIDVSNPQVYREPRKRGTKEDERAAKVAKLLNHWAKLLVSEIEEAKKNAMLRGEGWFQVEYNEDYNPSDENSLPIIITAPDPIIILGDPFEVASIPRRVVKACRMAVGQVEQMFPTWSNPEKRRTDDTAGVDYLAYWDAEQRYIEADKEGILGPQINIFGFNPFIHFYSGFGKRSPEGKPEGKAVGRLRKIRNRLVEECEIESRVDSIIGLFANPVVLVKPTVLDAGEAPSEEELEFSPGRNIVIPYGWDADNYLPRVDITPLLQHLYQIKSELGLELPPVALGLPSTSRATGRQEDIYSESYSRKYRTLRSNLETALAKALGLGLRIIEWQLDKLPKTTKVTVRATVLEDGEEIRKEEVITKEDIDGYYECRVEFKAEALADDRKVMLGRMLVNEGRIDWKTFLIEYVGYTEDKAEEVINQTLADQFILGDPIIRTIISREAAEKLGMQRQLKEIEEEAGRLKEMAAAPLAPAGEGRPSEARNPLAAGITRQMLGETPVGVRQSPRGMA